MSGQIAWRVELAVRPGRLDDFRALTGEMVEFTRSEAGVLSYERFVTGDARVVHVYERYANSAAAVAHLRNFADKFADRFTPMVERKSFIVYGDPSLELKAMLDGFGPVYLKPFGDFAYWA